MLAPKKLALGQGKTIFSAKEINRAWKFYSLVINKKLDKARNEETYRI